MDLINEYQQYQNAGVYEEGEDDDEYTEEYQHWAETWWDELKLDEMSWILMKRHGMCWNLMLYQH